MPYTKQPVLSSLPVTLIYPYQFDPPLANQNYDISAGNAPEIIFSGNNDLIDRKGGMIHRITVSACADVANNPVVTGKLIFLCLKGAGPATLSYWNLHKTAAMPGAIINSTTPNPEVVWEFEGGLPVYQYGDYTQIGILASTNYATTNERGDYLSCVVEYTDNQLIP